MDFQWAIDLGNDILSWFGIEENRDVAVAIATVAGAIVAVLAATAAATKFVLWPVYRLFSRSGPPSHNLPQPAPQTSMVLSGDVLSMDQHLTILDKREARLRTELSEAHGEQVALLQAQVAELEKQRANPEESLQKAQTRIRDLEALLERDSNEIGRERITEAKAALEHGDYSLADDIFAELEARNELAVQTTARAAFGRGEVAEAEIRWADAAKHYAKAARLAPAFETLIKASDYTQRAGDYATALRFSADLIAWAQSHGTQEQQANALNEHGVNAQAQGRLAEAEGLYRQALEIDRAAIGKAHPGYAIGLNNLGCVVQAQGRFAEAEDFYEQALEIDRVTIGGAHPNYAVHLGNLGDLIGQTGEVEEARQMLTQSLGIFRDTFPPEHPHVAESERKLDALPAP